MELSHLKLDEIKYTARFVSDVPKFSSVNKSWHIMGVYFGGRARHFFADRELLLSDNTVFFFNRDEDYSVIEEEKGLALAIHFTTEEAIETKSFAVRVSNIGEFSRLFDKIEAEVLSKNRYLALIKDFYAFSELVQGVYEKSFFKTDKRISGAEEYILMHFKETDCLERAAALTGLSRRRFNELFKKHYNASPAAYVTYLKIKSAKELLRYEKASVSRAAELSGFSDMYYFSKVFKKETGLTPTEYKKTHNN